MYNLGAETHLGGLGTQLTLIGSTGLRKGPWWF